MAFSYQDEILELHARASYERKTSEAMHDAYLAAVLIEAKAKDQTVAVYGQLALSVDNDAVWGQTTAALAEAHRAYSAAQAATIQLRDARDAFRETMTATMKLSWITQIRRAAKELKELGIEPVSMLIGYAAFTEQTPFEDTLPEYQARPVPDQ
jgi:hypothetical protein